MKYYTQNVTHCLLIVGLAAVTIVEALRPGTVGAATNLGVVVFVASLLLVFGLLSKPTATE